MCSSRRRTAPRLEGGDPSEVGEGLLATAAVFVGEAHWQRAAPSPPSVGQVVALCRTKAGSTSLEEDEPRGSCAGSVPAPVQHPQRTVRRS